MKVSFLSAALDEHLEQVEYYERCKNGLGAEYLAEVAAMIERIVEVPGRFPATYSPSFRKCMMKRFPFSIIFRKESDAIAIVAIAAHRRAPDYWLHR